MSAVDPRPRLRDAAGTAAGITGGRGAGTVRDTGASRGAPNSVEEPTWETARTTVPERPELVSNLPEEHRIPRPRRLRFACCLVLAGALCLAVVIALAAADLEALRDALISALPDDVADDYDEPDLERAADALLLVLAGAAVALMAGQLLGLRALLARRSAIARIVFVALSVLAVPVALLVLVVAAGDGHEQRPPAVVLVGAFLLASFAATVLVCQSPITRWLRQSEERRRIPLLGEHRRPSGS